MLLLGPPATQQTLGVCTGVPSGRKGLALYLWVVPAKNEPEGLTALAYTCHRRNVRPAPSAWLHPCDHGDRDAFGYKHGRGGICTLSTHLLGPEPPRPALRTEHSSLHKPGTSSHLSVSQPHSYPRRDRVWGRVLRGATAWTSPISTLTAHEVTWRL